MIKVFVVNAKTMIQDEYNVPNNIKLSDFLSQYLKYSYKKIDESNIGVYGKFQNKSYKLRDNDRVELYNKIMINPKISRKVRAKK